MNLRLRLTLVVSVTFDFWSSSVAPMAVRALECQWAPAGETVIPRAAGGRGFAHTPPNQFPQ